METVAELKHFYFAYKKNNLVLHDIDFKIEKGSFTVIAGPSGSGKTTLCKAMAGIVPFYMGGAYSGEVMVLGESTKGKKVSDIAMRLGLMLEDYESQLVSLTAGEEVAFSLLNHGFKPEEVEERTRRALEGQRAMACSQSSSNRLKACGSRSKKNRISSVTCAPPPANGPFANVCQTVNNQYTKNDGLCHERFAPGISFTFATPRDDPHALFANSHLWYNKGYNKLGRAGRAAPMEVS